MPRRRRRNGRRLHPAPQSAGLARACVGSRRRRRHRGRGRRHGLRPRRPSARLHHGRRPGTQSRSRRQQRRHAPRGAGGTGGDTLRAVFRLPDPVAGVRFREYRGGIDFPGLVAAYNGARMADGVSGIGTLGEVPTPYRHPTNCDLDRDLLIAQIDRGIVGYARVTWWVEEATSDRVLVAVFWLLPEARGSGVAGRVVGWGGGPPA